MSKGRSLILIGHAGHPEVEGTMGQVPGPVLLVQNVDEVAALDRERDPTDIVGMAGIGRVCPCDHEQ